MGEIIDISGKFKKADEKQMDMEKSDVEQAEAIRDFLRNHALWAKMATGELSSQIPPVEKSELLKARELLVNATEFYAFSERQFKNAEDRALRNEKDPS